MNVPRRALVLLSLLAFASAALAQDKPQSDKAASDTKLPTITEKMQGMQKLDGYIPLYWQASSGKLFMEIGRFNQELLYQVSLPAGLGSNPVGLDRGQLGDSQIAYFERIGQKVLLTAAELPLPRPDDGRRREGGRSPTRSRDRVLWGFKVEAEEDTRVLVDATAFFLRDAHGVADTPPRRETGTLQAR